MAKYKNELKHAHHTNIILINGIKKKIILLVVVPAILIMIGFLTFGMTGKPLPSRPESTVTGEILYVESAKSNIISVIDLQTNSLVRNVNVGNSPHDLKISADQRFVYSTDTDSGTISVIDTETNALVNQIATATNVHGIDLFNDTLYAGDVFGGKVLVIRDNNVIDTIEVGSGPEYMEVSPDGKILYVANLWSPISVVDLRENKIIKEIDSGKTPHGLSFTSDGSRLFIVNMKSDTLSVIDAKKHEVIKTTAVGKNPEYVKLTPDERFVYVTNLGSDTVSVINARTLEIVDEIRVGDGPHGIAFSADGDFAYVSNMNSNDVSVIDTSNNEVVASIPVGIEPHQLVTRKPIINIITESSTIPIYVEIANNLEEQSRGLMFRKNLQWNNGMLFVYNEERNLTFWMKNTLIPLDMIFIDKDLTIVDIKQNVQPCLEENCPVYPSNKPAKYVLEVNAGFVEENKIRIGDKLSL